MGGNIGSLNWYLIDFFSSTDVLCSHPRSLLFSIGFEECGDWQSELFSLSTFTFSTSSCPSCQGPCTRNIDEKFMLQLVTAREPRHKRPRTSLIIPAEALLEEGPAPAGVPYASPGRRHPRAIGHEQPIHMKQKQIVNKRFEMKECE